MSDRIQRLIDERARVWNQAQAHLDTVEAEGREFTGEADETWNRLNADLSGIDARIAELESIEDRTARVEEAAARYERSAPAAPEQAAAQTDDEILRAIANGERRGSVEFRDLTKGSATAGGNTVPTSFRAQLMEHMIETSAIRQTRVTVLSTNSGEDMQLPKTTSHSTAALVAEAAAISESDPAFGQVTIGAFKYGLIIQTSRELIEDTGVNLSEYLARQAGRAIGNATGAHMATGDGSSKPNGIVTASTAGVTGGTGQVGVPTTNELIDLYYSVIAPYRRVGEWQMSDQTVKAIRKLKDSDGQYIWTPGLLAGEPDTLLGKPVVVNTDIADAALSAKSVIFGDHSTYVIRDVNSVEVARSEDFAFANDLVTWRFLFRTDGDLVDTTGAVKHYVGGAS